jgi:hypothetical protein
VSDEECTYHHDHGHGHDHDEYMTSYLVDAKMQKENDWTYPPAPCKNITDAECSVVEGETMVVVMVT